MFASTNPFGQSSTSPFGSQSLFGQTSNASPNNPFAPKPFGGTTPFGAQTGSSIFGTATGVFGATQSSAPMASTPTFGASPAMGSSMPAFGASSTPAFGASSTPAFGSGSASFGGSSVFGQKSAFGGFGTTPSPASPFGSTSQQTQPAFGSNLFGSSAPFGSSNQPTFGATSAPAFGVTSTPTFGATSTPAFGSTATPAFGSTTTGFGGSSMPAFGSGGAFGASSTPAFGASTSAFGSSTPAFGGSSMPAFGTSNTTGFGASSSPAFGSASSTPAFGASSTPAFGASSTPSFSFGSSGAFGQSTAAFGSSPFGASSSSFGGQSTPFGTQSTTPAFGSTVFGQSTFGAQRGGSRIAAYTAVPEADGGSGTQPAGKLESISAMPVYKDKSHEELRWEDYQLGDKGGPNPTAQPASATGFGSPAAQPNLFGSPAFGQSSSSLFSASSSNPFSSKTTAFGSSSFGATTTPAFGASAFGASTANLFPTTSSSTSFTTPSFGGSTSPSLFGSSSSAFGSSPSLFASTSTPGTSASAFGSGLNFGNTQSAGLFQSTTPSLGQTTATFGQGTAPSFGQSSLFNTPSTGFGGNLFSNTSASSLSVTNVAGFGQTTPSLSAPFQSAQPSQPSGSFAFGNFGQTQTPPLSGFGGVPNPLGQAPFGQQSASYSPIVMQAPPVMNPFGTLPAMPQMSIGRAGSTPSVQYGISSMPAAEKPTPVRVSSLLTSRHISQRRIKLPARRYHPKADGSKVPFFSDDEETPSAPKADALVIPRENPRALVIHPMEKWPSTVNSNKSNILKDTSTVVDENGTAGDSKSNKDKDSPAQPSMKPNGMHEDQTTTQKGDSYITLTGHRAGEAAIVYEHGADVEALMPKLRHSDYYTEPRIQELAAKERAEPGFCSHVKDFVVGRHGYGSIRFIGETDVRRLDLESLVQFNNREVIVYMDESKKPPVGQGLNKPAEVTLLNIKCFDKNTRQQYTEGPKVEKYKEMLKKKAQEQGAEFLSYDPVKGEWKFRVNHFSRYELQDLDIGEEVEIDARVL